MRRNDRQKDRDFCLNVIDRCTHGVVALDSGEKTPYCLPLSLVRAGDVLYFHCALEGRKTELLAKNPRVCVTFVGKDAPAFVPPGMYTTYFESVIVTGTAEMVSDPQEKRDALRLLCQKLLPDRLDGFEQALAKSLPVTAVWRIRMDDICGKAK